MVGEGSGRVWCMCLGVWRGEYVGGGWEREWKMSVFL